MIKSVNQLVTRRCNGKCNMCNIWKFPQIEEMTINEFHELYSLSQFENIEDVCISGGEPTLRKDLIKVISTIIEGKSHLKMLFLSTNCSYPSKILEIVKYFGERVPEFYVVAPLEGDKETHKKIRGKDSYDSVIKTLLGLERLQIPTVKGVISTTLQKDNCNENSINHLEDIAQKTASIFTFRLADKSQVFYRNVEFEIGISSQQRELIMRMVSKRISDPFMNELYKELNGESTIMGSKHNLECLAGEITVFIDCDGTIRPCIYSNQRIGDKKGFYEKFQLLSTPSCPCCTECQVYPRVNYGGKNAKHT